jgi:CRP-like cAMP-binding protein
MSRLFAEMIEPRHGRAPMAAFLCRLRSLVTLMEREEHAIETLHAPPHAFAIGSHVYKDGDARVQPWIVATGWACRLRALPDGRRQIISFFLPGDTIGVNEIQHPAAQCAILALTDLQLLNAAKLAEALTHPDGAMPNVAEAFAKEAIRRRAQQLDHILRLGRLTAFERTAHLFLELHDRMDRAGLAQDGGFPMPLTQLQFGEALGLSLVHINRTLQHLRRDRLLELRSGWASILDRERLELLCDFKPIVL